MRWEEEKNGSRENLGLLFVIPKPALSDHWKKLGLKGPIIDEGFFARLDQTKLPDRVKKLFDREPAEIKSVLNRMSVDAISWTWLRDEIQKIEAEVTGGRNQTLERLLTGLRDQIERHQYTGIHPGGDSDEQSEFLADANETVPNAKPLIVPLMMFHARPDEGTYRSRNEKPTTITAVPVYFRSG